MKGGVDLGRGMRRFDIRYWNKSFSSYFLMGQAIHDPIFEDSPTLLPKMLFLRKTKCTSVISSLRGQSDGLNFNPVDKSQVCSWTVLQAHVVWDLHKACSSNNTAIASGNKPAASLIELEGES